MIRGGLFSAGSPGLCARAAEADATRAQPRHPGCRRRCLPSSLWTPAAAPARPPGGGGACRRVLSTLMSHVFAVDPAAAPTRPPGGGGACRRVLLMM